MTRTPVLVCVLVLISFVTMAKAQTDQGQIAGTVKDASGAIIPGAKISVRNQKTNLERTTESNSDGSFVVANLSPATYTITGKSEGLGPTEFSNVDLQVGEVRKVDFVLQPTAVTQQITVAAETPQIDTSSARIGGNVSEVQVAELPINGRQISQLYLMTPGAVNFGTGTFDDMRFNGRSYEENAIRYDGIDGGGIISNNPSDFNGEIPGPFRLQASMENVQEFRVDSNTYPAELGTGTGGQISICLLYTSPSPRDLSTSRMPSSA